MPVIIINEQFYGTEFVDFITNTLLGKCIIFIDEFEKIYNTKAAVTDIISIMDGNFTTNLIFLFTVNEIASVSTYLKNRLNRIKYNKRYTNLDPEIVEEVINDLLINKSYADSIKDFFDAVGMCTFDLLVNLIKEVNLFDEDAFTAAAYLNIAPEPVYFHVRELYNGKWYECDPIKWCWGHDICLYRKETNYISEEDKGTEMYCGPEIDLYINDLNVKRSGKVYTFEHIKTGAIIEFRAVEEPKVKDKIAF